MARETTSSFILTLPLKTTISDESAINKYMELSRRYYNIYFVNKKIYFKKHYISIRTTYYLIFSLTIRSL